MRVRVGVGDAERGRDGPAERARLAAVDPVARPVDVQHLRAGDLGEADGGDVPGLGAEGLVHLLVDALRLDRDVVEVRTALQRPLALAPAATHARAVGQLPAAFSSFADLDEQLQRGLGVGGDAVVRGEDLADLGGLDVDVDERAAAAVDVQVAGVAVGPAVADAEDEVRLQEGRVAVAVRGLQADHAGVQLVVVGDDAPAHQGRDRPGTSRNSANSTSSSEASALMIAAAGDDQRALDSLQQVERLLDLRAGRGRLVRPAAARTCRGRTRSRSAGRRSAGRSGPGRGGRSASGGRPAGRRRGPARPPAR